MYTPAASTSYPRSRSLAPKRYIWFASALSWALILGLDPTAAADVTSILDQAPADTDMLIVVSDMADLNQRVAMLNTRLDLQVPDLASAMTQFKRSTGLATGIRDSGPLLICVSVPDGDDADRESVLMLLPYSDYGAMVRPIGGDPDAATTQVKLATGHAAYIKKSGEFAVVGKSREQVAAFRPAVRAMAITGKLGSVGNQCLERAQMAAIIHGRRKGDLLEALLKALKPVSTRVAVAPTVTKTDDQAARRAETGPPSAGQRHWLGGEILANMAKQQFATETNLSQAPIVRDAEAIVLAIDIDDSGLALSSAFQFKTGTALSKAFKKSTTAAGHLSRMPDMPYMGAYAVDLTGVDLGSLGQLPSVSHVAGQSDWVEQTIVAASKQDIPVVGLAQVMYVPASGAPIGAPTSSVKVIQTTAPQDLTQALRTHLDRMNQQDTDSEPQISTTYTPNRLKIDGHRVDQYLIKQGMTPETLEQLGAAAQLLKGLGWFSTQTTGYIVATDSFVIVTESIDQILLRRVLESLDTQTGLGADGAVANARKRLFEGPAAEAYVDLGGIFNSPMGSMLAVLSGQAANIPTDLSPISIGLNVAERGFAARMVLPMSDMAFVKTLLATVSAPADTQQELDEQPFHRRREFPGGFRERRAPSVFPGRRPRGPEFPGRSRPGRRPFKP